MEKNVEYRVIDCECYSPQHKLKISKDEDYEGLLIIKVNLNPETNFFKRIWLGSKYIFGFKTGKSYFFEESILDKDVFIKTLQEL